MGREDKTGGVLAPGRGLSFQFRRFQVKNLSIGADLAAQALRGDNYSGFTKWLGAVLLLGGLKGALHPISLAAGGSFLTLAAYNALVGMFGDDEDDKKRGRFIADLVAYGLPSIVGIDLSFSMQLVDVPLARNVPEAIGGIVLGPLPSTALRMWSATADEKGIVPEPSQRALNALKGTASGRMIEGIEAAWSGDYNFRTASGKVRFKTDLKGALKHAAGFRTLTEAEQDRILSALLEVKVKRDRVLDDAVQDLLAWRRENRPATDADRAKAEAILARWNAWWPEAPLRPKDVTKRANRRAESVEDDTLERALTMTPKPLRRWFQRENEARTETPRPVLR